MRNLGKIGRFSSRKIAVTLSVLTVVILISGALTRSTVQQNIFKFHTSIEVLPRKSLPQTTLPQETLPQELLPQETLPQNSSCPRLNFSKELLPKTALASFPGSGNTWMRHLLQQMTGIATGAIYDEPYLHTHGFPGEGIRDGRVVAIKTHNHFSPGPVYDRCILLMRNPFEAFIAEFNRRCTGNQTGSVGMELFVKYWNGNFTEMCGHYESFHLSWLKHQHVHPVLFTNLKKDLPRELHRTLVFLQNSTQITGNVHCALNNSRGIVKRDQSKNLPRHLFYPKDKKQKLNWIIEKLSSAYSSRFPEEAQLMSKWVL